jgi:hypothetical protein
VSGGLLVKILRYFLLLVILGSACGAALADSVNDPGVKLKGGGGSTGLFSPTDANFAFSVRGGDFTVQNETRFFDFINATGQLAVEIDLTVTLLANTPALTFTCDPLNEYFTDCSPQSPGTTVPPGGSLLIRFFTPNNGELGFGGIPFATDLSSNNQENCDGVHFCFTDTPGADFEVGVSDVNGDLVNLATGQGFDARGIIVTATPEPATLLLFLTGAVLLLHLKRP